MPGELSWDHLIEDIPATGLTVERLADTEERERLRLALDLVGLPELRARYHITPTSYGRYELAGELAAIVDQTCVATLEPVRSEVAETYTATYWPPEAMPGPIKGQLALDAEPDPEAIVDGSIDVGRIVFESLAAAIDPFPRLPGAVFEGPLSTPEGQKPESPFAVLANLKAKS